MKALGSTRARCAAAITMALFGVSISASPLRAIEPMGDAHGLGELGARIIAAEGGPGRNPLSSAAGYGQFLSGTWLEIFERAYPQVAQTMTREQILALREIKPLAEDLTNRYAQANAATLRGVGLPASAGELSLAHAIGPRGAASVLAAEPTRPAAELLGPEAIAANPVLKEMTASALRRWAMLRVNPRGAKIPEGGAPKTEVSLEPLRPADDFRGEEPAKASEARVIDYDAGAVLQDLVDASSNAGGRKGVRLRPSTAVWLMSVGVEPSELLRGDAGAVRIFKEAASLAVLGAIRSLSDRPGFHEFKAIEAHAAGRGALPPAVVRAVAIAMLDKIKRHNAIIARIGGRRWEER